MNDWSDNQKLFESWWKLLSPPIPGMQTPTMAMPAWGDWISGAQEQWRNAFTPDAMPGFTSQLPDVTRVALEQFMAGQQQSLHLMGMTAQAWQTIMSGAASPDEWPNVLRAYIEQLRQQMNGSLNAYKTVQNNIALWQQYSEEMGKLSQPWLSYWQQIQQTAGQATDPRQAAVAGVGQLTHLFWETFNQRTGRLLGAPSLGLTREFSEKLNRSFLLWQTNQRASVEYQLLIGNTWIDAFAAFMQKLLNMAVAGEAITQPAKLLDLWVEIADEQFVQVFHSDTFAQVQSAYINSSMALRRQQRELTEVWLRMQDLPTRSDLDAAHQAIFELRQEVKAMKKILRAKTTVTAPAPPPEVMNKTPKRRTAHPKTVANTSGKVLENGVEGK